MIDPPFGISPDALAMLAGQLHRADGDPARAGLYPCMCRTVRPDIPRRDVFAVHFIFGWGHPEPLGDCGFVEVKILGRCFLLHHEVVDALKGNELCLDEEFFSVRRPPG